MIQVGTFASSKRIARRPATRQAVGNPECYQNQVSAEVRKNAETYISALNLPDPDF